MTVSDELKPVDAPEETKAKKESFFDIAFAFLDSINRTKQNIMQNEQDERKYAKVRFVILNALSAYAELVPYVNLANQRNMSPRMEYDFLLNVVPIKKRYDKWPKRNPKSLFLHSVQQYYGYNETRAEEAMKILTVDQLTMIETIINKEDHICEGMTINHMIICSVDSG